MPGKHQRGKGEGSIYQRADGKWCAALHTVDGKRKVLYGKTRQDVARKLTAALQAREQGALVVGPRQTVAQFFDRWLSDVVAPNLRPRSYKVYEGKTRLHIVPELGKVSLAALTPQHLQRLYAKKIAEGVAPKSVNNLHVVIHRALSYAVRWGLVARNVANAAEPPRVPRREIEPFSAEDIAILLQAIKGHRHQWLWTTMLATGIRFGEAAALRWSDVDLDARIINVRHTLGVKNRGPMFAEPKTTKARRFVPLPQIAVQALTAQLEQVHWVRAAAGDRWQELDLVFPSPSGRPLSQSHALERFHRVLDQAGLRRRRMHDLRHTYATQLFTLGQHPRAVQDLLGHSRFEITMNLYTASVPEVLRDAADQLDLLFQRAQGNTFVYPQNRLEGQQQHGRLSPCDESLH